MKKHLALLLALCLCLCMAACGGDDIAGADWRTTGVVDARGTITQNGERVDVCVCIKPDSAAFYRDTDTQVLFDSVSFPQSFSDADQAFASISFDDITGDGESDVVVDLTHEDMSCTHMVWFWDAEERYVFQPDYSYFHRSDVQTEPPLDCYADPYAGLWKYTDLDRWLRINSDGTWEFLNSEGGVLDSGTLLIDENGLELQYESGDLLWLEPSEDGSLIDRANEGVLVRLGSDEISATPAFQSLGVDFCSMDSGTHLLENGVVSFTDDGSLFTRGDCYWEVSKVGDYTHDGLREIEFTAYCYVPHGALPDLADSFIFSTTSELYDFYSGMWLTASSSFQGSERADNHYLHTVEWQGERYEIEFFYSTQWEEYVDDWRAVLTKSYIVYLPEDYDGLIFAALAEPDNFEDEQRRQILDTICPEASILTCDTVDPYSNLYFTICE